MQKIVISKDNVNRRLDKYLCFVYKIPYSNVMKKFRQKDIKVNGVKTNNYKYLIQEGDEIITYFKILEKENKPFIKRLKYDFELIYEDENIIIVDKNHGIEISGNENSLLNQVRNYFANKFDNDFFPINVHQLDKWTRGLVVFACNYQTITSLQKKWQTKNFVIKKYLAKLEGKFSEKKEIVTWMMHCEKTQKEIITSKNKKSKMARSIFIPLSYDQTTNSTFCEIEILTGRKHQIRCQANHMKYPIIGDGKYGNKTKSKLKLVAYKLSFNNFTNHMKNLNGKEFIIKNIKWWNK